MVIPLLRTARSGMERLFSQVRDAGYVVLLTDARGITVDFINNDSYDRELRRAGLYLGACWAEEVEGTCAVGLCTVERVPLTVHHDEHFRSPNTSLTCSSAPIFDPRGELLAVLDASALFSPDDKRSQHLVLQMVSSTARMVENAYFLRQFQGDLVLRMSSRREFLDVEVEGLLALDDAGVILAGNTMAQAELAVDGQALRGLNLQQLFDLRVDDLLRAAQTGAAPVTLRSLRTARRYFAQVYPGARAPRPMVAQVSTRQGAADAMRRLAGGDAQMSANVGRALRVLDKGIAVLLHGETGTGKEAFAQAMHEASARAAAPFVALNCAAIPESLIESELFGYRDGAFTGARAKGVRGKILQADGGTLFLDEIGDMPLPLQTRLLRVLAEREVMPLGAEKPVPVDMQVICATHRDLTELVRAGQFRQDLYYRLNGVALRLPALRERGDKPELVPRLLREEAQALGREASGIADDAMAVLLRYEWPGNIRQLKNTLRCALALSDDGEIALDHLPSDVRAAHDDVLPLHSQHSSPGIGPGMPQPAVHAQAPGVVVRVRVGADHSAADIPPPPDGAVADPLLAALRRSRWNVAMAARELGLCRATVYRRMQRQGIVPPNQRGE